MLVPSSKSSEAQTNESIVGPRVRRRLPGTRPGRPRTSAPCSETLAVVGVNPDQPTPAMPTRGSIGHGYTVKPWTSYGPLTRDDIERANVTRLMRAHGIDTFDELRRPLGGRHRVVLGRRGAGPRDRVHRSLRRGRRSFAGTGVGHLVHAGHDQPRASVRRPVGRAHPRGGRRGLGGRGRRGPPGDVSRAPRPDRSARERARRPRRAVRATPWASSCRWRSRPSPRSWRARSSARSGCRSSAGSAPMRSRRGWPTPRAEVLITAGRNSLRQGLAGRR